MLRYIIYFFMLCWIVYAFSMLRESNKMIDQGADWKSVQLNLIKRIFISLGIFTLLSLTLLFLFGPKGSESYQQEIPRSGTLENDTIVKAIWIQFACDCPRWVAYEAYLDESYLEDNCEDIGACFNIEASNKTKIIPDTFYSSLPIPVLEFSGRFYKKKQKFRGDDRYFYARLFQYDAYEIVD